MSKAGDWDLKFANPVLICYGELNIMQIVNSSKASTSEERRLKYERRQYTYADHIPERRSGQDRRDETEASAPEDSEN